MGSSRKIAPERNREYKKRHQRRTKALEWVTFLALIGLGATLEQAEELSRALVVENLERLKRCMIVLAGWDYEAIGFKGA